MLSRLNVDGDLRVAEREEEEDGGSPSPARQDVSVSEGLEASPEDRLGGGGEA